MISPTNVVGSSVFTENIKDFLYFSSVAAGLWSRGSGLFNVLQRRIVAYSRLGGDGDL